MLHKHSLHRRKFTRWSARTWMTRTRGVWDLQRSPPLMNQGLLIQFFDFLIAVVFLHEIYRAAKIQCIGGSRGVTKVGLPKFILSVVFRKTLIADKTHLSALFFDIMYNISSSFFQFFPGGSQIIFHQKPPKTDRKILTFSIFIK